MLTLFIQRLTKALFYIGALLFLSIILLTLANIIMRLFGSSIRGTIELCGYLSAASIGLCLPQVQIQKAHSNAGIFFEKLPKNIQSFQAILVGIISFFLVLAMFFELLDLTIFVHEGMEVVDGFDIPSALFIGILTISLAMQSLVLVCELLLFIKALILKIKPNTVV